jgi:DNA-directed RNA polymerase specialized sigma24 family protein
MTPGVRSPVATTGEFQRPADDAAAAWEQNWSRWLRLARSLGGNSNVGMHAADDLLVGALLRAARTGVAWDRLNDKLVNSFLRFEVRHCRRRDMIERKKLEFVDDSALRTKPSAEASPADFGIPTVEAGRASTRAVATSEHLAAPEHLFRLRASGLSWRDIAKHVDLSCAACRKRASRWRAAIGVRLHRPGAFRAPKN